MKTKSDYRLAKEHECLEILGYKEQVIVKTYKELYDGAKQANS